ncbi:MAG TPA: hypothetical protein VGY76_11225 [Solirubrobacteraceae bacterium]|jgi:hypothetical protein|nr:hypothetical protein [Solirubrobacteraceae bacterium]
MTGGSAGKLLMLSLIALAYPLVAAGVTLAAVSASPRGHAAKVIAVSDSGHLHLANPNSAGNTLIEEGKAIGTLPGSVRASLTIGTSTVRVGFTIYLHGGTITGHGTASFNPGKGEYASFGGSVSVSHGSGHYAHATGSGRMYGSINRTTDNANVQVIGQLHF